MPRLNSRGEVAMGIAGTQGSVNRNNVPDSLGPYWFNDDEVIFFQPSSNSLVIMNVRTNARRPADSRPANDIRAGGNNWAAWANLPGVGLFSPNLHLSEAGLLDVGPDGAIGYKPIYQSDRGAAVHELNDEKWTLTNTDIVYDLRLLGNRRAIWRNEFNQIRTVGIPQPIQIGNVYWPMAVEVNGEWWVSYFSEIAGTVLHPFNSTVGYQLLPPNVDAFYTTSLAIAQSIMVAWSSTTGERPIDLRDRMIHVTTDPRIELVPSAEIPRIGKPCWLTWFEFIQNPSPLPPGNSLVRFKTPPEGNIRKFDGTQFAQWAQGSTVEEIERQAMQNAYPTVAYWDSRYWPRWPHLPQNAWLAIQAYCRVNETPNVFEQAMRDILGNTPPGRKVALVCQCYTSNLTLTNNLSGLVPVYAKLARDFVHVDMLLAFSDQGRATGLQDHPEVRPSWEKLFEGITGEPQMSLPQLPPEICEAVEKERAKYGAIPTSPELAQILNDTAWQFPPDWGLSRKDAGNHVNSPDRPGLGNIASDILHRKSDNLIWDVLIAAGERAEPHCGEAIGEMTDPNRPWVAPVQPPEVEPEEGTVGILHFDSVVRRSDPNGMLIRFDVHSVNPVLQIELDLENDGEPSIILNLLDEERRDGRYVRALAFKPTVNGTWPLRVTARDNEGRTYKSDGSHMVIVTL